VRKDLNQPVPDRSLRERDVPGTSTNQAIARQFSYVGSVPQRQPTYHEG
jgi:hypothetical protein